MAWTESVGWYDVAELFESSNGSLGYILSCLETKPGEPWIKLVSETYEGEIAVGSTYGEVIVVGIRYRDGHVCGFSLLGIESCCGCFDYRRAVEVEVDREVEQ